MRIRIFLTVLLLTALCIPASAEDPVLPDLTEYPDVDRLIVVSVRTPTDGTVAFYRKTEDGGWERLFSGPCYTGRKGLDKTAEGDGRTPTGLFPMGIAFGNEPDPGATVPYLQVDGSYYWVDDGKSPFYNQLVSTRNVKKNWRSAERISSSPKAYAYCVDIQYNPGCIPGKGSAIFLHCEVGKTTSGCIAVERDVMISILQNMTENTMILIQAEPE